MDTKNVASCRLVKGSLDAEKYCRVQLLIIQKGVDEDEISVSIGDREDNAIVEGISFNSCLSFFQADEVG